MLIGYTFILLAALCWGSAGVIAKHWAATGFADALLLSQTRVAFSWMVLFVWLAFSRRALLKINRADFLRFALLGIVGMAGANFLLYFAIGRMNVAVADLIQFTAPILVATYLALRGVEPMDMPKAVALVLSLAGCALALNLTGSSVSLPLIGALSAFGSALCFAFVIVYGKRLNERYSLWTYLHYGLLAGTIFWCCVNPPNKILPRLADPASAMRLVAFAMLSILAPYTFFFNGLKRVAASRAAIVSTFEPVVMALGSWLALGDPLHPVQVLGIALVLAAIVLVELTSNRGEAGHPSDKHA